MNLRNAIFGSNWFYFWISAEVVLGLIAICAFDQRFFTLQNKERYLEYHELYDRVIPNFLK